MDHLNDLPKRHRNHLTEGKAVAAFQSLLAKSEDFVLQASDISDFGTDCQIEVVDRENATNIRVHVQLKGTEVHSNADGSVSVEIRRSNLNYLLMQPLSFFVCYHVPTDTLRFCYADAVVRRYQHQSQDWTKQQSLTVNFSEILTGARLASLAALARSGAVPSRDIRVAQTTARPEDLIGIVRRARPVLHVPADDAQAAAMLSSLYESGADNIISAAFDQFTSALGSDHDAMIFCYMAEINLGMAKRADHPARIVEGLSFLRVKLGAERFDEGSLYYSIGNGLSALGREEEAAEAFETALQHMKGQASTILLAQCYKNLGSSYERLGNQDHAIGFFREALRHDPQLPEAHFALGLICHRKGEYEGALQHFDQVVFAERTLGKRSSVSGWRINALFNLSDGKSAFRELNTLLSDAEDEYWIWPWCAQQVASFGRGSPESARLGITFWDRYLKVHPNCPSGVRERLLSKLYLRSEGQLADLSYHVFKAEFDASIQYVQGEAAAYLWDRLGHWAQEDDNWEEAERCFRISYDIAGGHYGYCLGTALNFLNRFEESLPILLAQAEELQPDDVSWYQVAIAYEKLGRTSESIDAYTKVVALNPHHELAWFNMGGVYWNAGELEQASHVWKVAVDRFPDHELADLLRRKIPFVLV